MRHWGRRAQPAIQTRHLTETPYVQVISHLYELHGEKVASMLDGFFAFVVLDTRNNTFYAARDPIGITCMYIGWGRDGSVWLSSEMKCLKVRMRGAGLEWGGVRDAGSEARSGGSWARDGVVGGWLGRPKRR